MISIGVIGYGYWGPNLVRNFAEVPGVRLAAVADLDRGKLELVQRRFPAVKATTDFQDLLRDPEIDAIAVANVEATLAAILPDRVLDEPGKGLRKRRIELPGVDPLGDGCNNVGAAAGRCAGQNARKAQQRGRALPLAPYCLPLCTPRD